jgi:hypothetical protein
MADVHEEYVAHAHAAAAAYDAVVNLALEEAPSLGALARFEDLPESIQTAVVNGLGPLVPAIINVARADYEASDG